jgi:predicted naringenin-chalcone synthase
MLDRQLSASKNINRICLSVPVSIRRLSHRMPASSSELILREARTLYVDVLSNVIDRRSERILLFVLVELAGSRSRGVFGREQMPSA